MPKKVAKKKVAKKKAAKKKAAKANHSDPKKAAGSLESFATKLGAASWSRAYWSGDLDNYEEDEDVLGDVYWDNEYKYIMIQAYLMLEDEIRSSAEVKKVVENAYKTYTGGFRCSEVSESLGPNEYIQFLSRHKLFTGFREVNAPDGSQYSKESRKRWDEVADALDL